jgi:hypothetical protein
MTTIINSPSFLKKHYIILLQLKTIIQTKFNCTKVPFALCLSHRHTQNNFIIHNFHIIVLAADFIGQQTADPGKFLNCHVN